MARIRSIKPAFWASEALATRLPGPDGRQARLLFIGLWGLAEDLTGVLRGHPSRIRSDLFAYDEDVAASDVDRWLGLLEAGRFIVRYERDGSRYVWIRGFAEHQKIDKPSKSTLPEPSDQEKAGRSEPSPSPPRALPEPSAPEVGRRKGGGEEEDEDLSPSAPASAAPGQANLLPDVPPTTPDKPKRRRKTTSDDSDPRHHPLKLALVAAGWPFDGGKDAANLKAILALADQQEATAAENAHAEVLRRAKIAWDLPGYDRARNLTELRLKWARATESGSKTRQQEIWEGLQERRKEALEESGRTYTPEMATAEYINTALARWKDTKKADGSEELTALGASFGHYCEDPRYLEKGLPVKLFLSPGVFAECEAKDKATLFYIADLRAPGIR